MISLVVSDLHLGSPNCRAGQIAKMLNSRFDRLILNGDTVQNLNLKKFKPKHWRVIDRLREIARKRELILIRGNHDGESCEEGVFGPLDVLATLLGVPLREEYLLEVGFRRYLVLHGDRFDPTLHWPILTDAADWCYHSVQKVNKKAAKWLKRQVKERGGVIEILKRRATEHARVLDCQGIITGHTHFSEEDWVEDIHYLNSGCWTDKPSSFILADSNEARLCHWGETLIEPAEEEQNLLCPA